MPGGRKRIEALVKPALLVWARTDAGVALEDAARRAQITPDRLAAWEQGDARPSMAQLRRLAALYKRPLAVFFLPEPPKDFAALKDFRRLPGKVAGVLSPALRFAIRRARERRQLALELYRAVQGEPPTFMLRVAMDDPERAGDEVRRFLGVGVDEQITWGVGYGAFNRWRAALEDHGVLVFQARDIDPDDMRGFSISDTPLPAVVLNIKDVPNARTFTMLHEVVHLALRQGGVCDLDEDPRHPPEARRVEVFCNHAAGAALVPRGDLLSLPVVAGHAAGPWADRELVQLAARYGVSREVVLRRLLILGRTSETFYRRKRNEFSGEHARRPQGGFAPPHLLAVAQAGPLFTRLVLANYYRDRVTATDVADYLAVNLKHLPKIETEMLGVPGATPAG